jgi:hypothetical protein
MKKIVIYIIKLYKKLISPLLSFWGVNCKFYPTCSEYTMHAIQKYGILKGCFLGMKRILKCNPFGKGGYDPLK